MIQVQRIILKNRTDLFGYNISLVPVGRVVEDKSYTHNICEKKFKPSDQHRHVSFK